MEKGKNDMFKFEKTDNGYMASIRERIVAERIKEVDSLILGEIRKIAIDNEIETRIILNEKNIAEALRNYQDGYKSIKAEVAMEIFEEIEKWLVHEYMPYIRGYSNSLSRNFAELKKKYTEGGSNG